MTTAERIEDMMKTGKFNDEEIEVVEEQYHGQTFKSWEYYFILHLTDAELYYMDEQTLEAFNDESDYTDTEKGRIYHL